MSIRRMVGATAWEEQAVETGTACRRRSVEGARNKDVEGRGGGGMGWEKTDRWRL
jgi:hypothetical protein